VVSELDDVIRVIRTAPFEQRKDNGDTLSEDALVQRPISLR
jgi:hypothetical protein